MPDHTPFPARWDPEQYPLRRGISFVTPDRLFELLRDALAAGVPQQDLPKLSVLIANLRFVRPPTQPVAGRHASQRGRERAEIVLALVVFVLVLVVLVLGIPTLNLGVAIAIAAVFGFAPLGLIRWARPPVFAGVPGMGCLNCGYDLTAAHKAAAEVRLGQAVYELCRCSECGLLWPSHVTEHDRTDTPVTLLDRTPIDAADFRVALIEVRMALAAAQRNGHAQHRQ